MNKNIKLFKVYLMAGSFTFSGGMAMLPLVERELCDKHNLMDKQTLYEYSALAQTFPGVIALNNACFVGKKINGTSGMIAAGLGAIFPAYVLMSIATVLYQLLPQEGIMLSVLAGIRATSTAFLFTAALGVAKHSLKTTLQIVVAILCFGLTVLNLVSAPLLIAAAGIIGFVLILVKKEPTCL
ncbi:chromate transporter [Erysipelothrix sp. HDW6C]|uniref:chromate transporter n=1 Tax=Erysipelothrix sp. HDW6C TaxID=2714930 RepID=UPI00140CB647|nr:chromate transporter [Erysipelothrix sp. HDW6C]QIK70566.1 chromate transporter [Erysipelothrix sp. HDW6C]